MFGGWLVLVCALTMLSLLASVVAQGIRELVGLEKGRVRSAADYQIPPDRCLYSDKEKELLRRLMEGIPHNGHVTGNVVIVGAGMAGLTAAMLLEDIGIRVTILEASGRPGGRVQTFRKDGWYADLGGMRIPNTQKIMLELLKQLGIAPTDFCNNCYEYYVHQQHFKKESLTNQDTLNELHNLYTNENGTMEKTPIKMLEDGFEKALKLMGSKKGEKYLDQFSVESYFRQVMNMTSWQIQMMGIFGLVEGLYYTGLVENLKDYCVLNEDGHYQEVTGGMDRVVEALIEKRLRKTKIIYNAKVSEVDQTPCTRTNSYIKDCFGNVRVTYKCEGIHCKDGVGKTVGDYVIVTASAPVAALIKYKPRLSKEKVHAMRKVHYDNSVKIILVFSKPFWEEKGFFGGKLISDLLVRTTYYPSHSFNSGVGVLLASYVWGEDANKWTSLTDQQCIQQALDDIVELHGHVARDTFKEGVVKKWIEDPLTMGSFAWPLPYQQPLIKHLRSSEGRIMFGGEHTDEPNAWIETAVKSGIRAASEVVEGLQQPSWSHKNADFRKPSWSHKNAYFRKLYGLS